VPALSGREQCEFERAADASFSEGEEFRMGCYGPRPYIAATYCSQSTFFVLTWAPYLGKFGTASLYASAPRRDLCIFARLRAIFGVGRAKKQNNFGGQTN
jgi:hypothetical protein